MGFTAAERRAIMEARGAHAMARLLAGANSNSEIARTVGSAGIETVALASSQGAPSQSRKWLQDLRHLRLDITGDDLIANGIQQGPAIGEALAAARDALYDGAAPDRESQLQLARRAAG
jgi:tRNA nucleotidyltransferase (CCA-adding enzyme)